MKKCHYCDSAVPDSAAYCSVMCMSMAREDYLESAYPRRGRADDEELKALRAEVERLREAARQVHALAWVPTMEAIRQIREITKGMVE